METSIDLAQTDQQTFPDPRGPGPQLGGDVVWEFYMFDSTDVEHLPRTDDRVPIPEGLAGIRDPDLGDA